MALSVLASIGGSLAHERSQTLEEAAALSERRAARLAGELRDALAVAVAVAVAVAAAAVQRIEARLEQVPSGDPVAGVLAALAAEQRPLLAALPQPLRLLAVSADWRPLAADAAAPGETETLPAADGWQVGLTRGAAGSRSVPVLRRTAPHRHGVAAFVVELDHAALVARLESSRPPDGGTAALFRIDVDGSTTLLARALLAEADIGRRVRGPLAAAVARSPRGSFSAQTQLDQVRRIVAYQRLDGELAALVVAYGMATDQVLADWWALLPWAAGAGLLLLGGIGAGVRRLETALQAQADQLQALQRSENQFRALATNLPDVVVRYDRDGRHLFTNPAVEQATGLPPQAFAGKTNAELGMPADRVEQWMACLRRVFTSGQPERLEFDYPGPDGQRHWESLVVLEPLLPGAAPTALVISRDITERRQMLQALQLSEQRLREAQQLASIGSWTLDIGSGALECSDEVFRIFDLDPARFEANYGHFFAAIHPDDRAAGDQAWQTAVAEHSDYAITHRLLLPDGRIKHVQERGRCSYADDGTPLRALGTVQDVTTRVQAEQALRRMNEELERRVLERTAELVGAKNVAERANLAKSEFLSRMSHELRTPLNAILGFGQLLEIQPDATARSSYVHEILNAGRHLLTLIDEVLDLARVESGNLTVSPEPVAVLPLVQECQTLLRLQAQARGIRLVDPSALCAVHVRADRTRLKQVLLNLLSNAVKYNREGGSVSVACVDGDGTHPGALRIRVHDTGAGLSPEQLPRLFVPFDRLGAEEKRIPGTGIGLALSKRLVELMGGMIGVESAPGSGFTFWVELPLDVPHAEAARPAAPAPAPAHALPATSQREVLCIEDNPANLRLIESIFERRSDIRLLTAMDPSLGLELARTHRPALILLDINLPDMDGYAVMQCLRENDATRRIPVMAISANAMPRDLERAKAAGFAAYLTKPLDVPALMARVDALLLDADRGPATS